MSHFDDSKALQAIENITLGGGVFLAEQDGVIIGMIGGLASEHLFTQQKTAYAICHYVHPLSRGTSAGVRLIKAFEKWAFEIAQVNATILCPSTGIEMDRVIYFMKNWI